MLKTKPCPDCDGRGFIAEFTEYSVLGKKCSTCDGLGKIEVPMTNADRIRAMSDEELAYYLKFIVSKAQIYGMAYVTKRREWIDWLKQPAE